VYLSRLILNPRNRYVRRDLADCQELHCTVLNGLPEDESHRPRDRWHVLYRTDVARTGRVTILVQSDVAPTWAHLPAGYLTLAPDNPGLKPVAAAYASLSPQQLLSFRLRANPTRRVAKEDNRLFGKRVELQTYEDKLDWLARKGEHGGFALAGVRMRPEIPDVRAVTDDKQRGGKRKASTKPGGRLVFGSVLFEGHLRITDADVFRQTLVNGIGSGKAYGFGLLSIAPA
jgi:CRISPR system Cascade subunit CasE